MDSSGSAHEDPFAEYHRARRRAAAVRAVLGLAAVAAVALASIWLATVPSGSAAAQPSAQTQPTKILSMAPTDATPAAKPSPTPHPSPSIPPAPAPHLAGNSTSTRDVQIAITATGYQHELDECQWVRMDLGAVAPIVGAHTQCGGAVVLTLSAGQFVDLTGEGLTGRYVVTDIRNAHSGDDAATALAGMDATVVLQTCYPGTGGRERLVGLEPA